MTTTIYGMANEISSVEDLGQCGTCGAAIADETDHKRWHDKLELLLTKIGEVIDLEVIVAGEPQALGDAFGINLQADAVSLLHPAKNPPATPAEIGKAIGQAVSRAAIQMGNPPALDTDTLDDLTGNDPYNHLD